MYSVPLFTSSIVLATAKIHILKQFTTQVQSQPPKALLCLLLQRYTFWSNSQRGRHILSRRSNCACYCKDTHFEAIHNYSAQLSAISELCLLLQRYTFWSNSQLKHNSYERVSYCACYCKDTHFEAIHNITSVYLPYLILCLLLQRYTFWSNSQHFLKRNTRFDNCACYCKDTHFEAIHNDEFKSC